MPDVTGVSANPASIALIQPYNSANPSAFRVRGFAGISVSKKENLFNQEGHPIMKRYFALMLTLGSLLSVAPSLMAQDHIEVGAFANYFRLGDADPSHNFVGVGGRAAVNVRPSIQLEAEMAYDFKRSFTQTLTDGAATELVNTHFRTLHAFFGPKFQTGSGPFRFFVTGKVGFDNFSVTNDNATAGFTSAVGLTSGTTRFAVYPGGGIEAFAGRIGVRAEIGDDIYFLNGAHNNLRVSLGPQIRF
jgi:hypothetical protein